MFCFNDFTAKHLSTEAQGGKDIEELSRADAGKCKSPLLPTRDAVPVTKGQMPLGTYWFGVVDHKKTFSFNIRSQFKCYFYVQGEINNLCLYFLHVADLDAGAEFSALEEISDAEAVSMSVTPAMPPASTSLRDYVDQSETLSKLVQLGN